MHQCFVEVLVEMATLPGSAISLTLLSTFCARRSVVWFPSGEGMNPDMIVTGTYASNSSGLATLNPTVGISRSRYLSVSGFSARIVAR